MPPSMVGGPGLLLCSLTWFAVIGGSAVAAISNQYGVVFGTGYNATTQYFNKNSSVTYTDESCTDFFTIVLGLDVQNSTSPTGSISYQDLESGVVLAKSELIPQGSIFTGGPSYSIANATRLKSWRLPRTYSKVAAIYHSSQTHIAASSANNFNISFAGQSAIVLSTFARVTVSLGIPTLAGCSSLPLATKIEDRLADLNPFHVNTTSLLRPSAAAPAPSSGQTPNVSRVIITAVLTKYNLTAFNKDLQTLYEQTIKNITGVRAVNVLSLRSGSVLIDTEVFIDNAALPAFATSVTSDSSTMFPPDGILGPLSILESTGGRSPGCSVNVRLRVFIPTPIVFVDDPFGIIKIAAFNGNDRTFCNNCGTSKADIQTTFSVTPSDLSGITSAGPGIGAFDTSMQYNVKDTEPLPGGPFWAGQLIHPNTSPIASKQLQRTNDNLSIQSASTQQPDTLAIHVDGSNPLFTFLGIGLAPPIRADISLTFDIENGDITFAASGKHDGFPAYELYINQNLIYSYDPLKSGGTPFALFTEGITVNVPPTILFNSIKGCHPPLPPPPPPPPSLSCDGPTVLGVISNTNLYNTQGNFDGKTGLSCQGDGFTPYYTTSCEGFPGSAIASSNVYTGARGDDLIIRCQSTYCAACEAPNCGVYTPNSGFHLCNGCNAINTPDGPCDNDQYLNVPYAITNATTGECIRCANNPPGSPAPPPVYIYTEDQLCGYQANSNAYVASTGTCDGAYYDECEGARPGKIIESNGDGDTVTCQGDFCSIYSWCEGYNSAIDSHNDTVKLLYSQVPYLLGNPNCGQGLGCTRALTNNMTGAF